MIPHLIIDNLTLVTHRSYNSSHKLLLQSIIIIFVYSLISSLLYHLLESINNNDDYTFDISCFSHCQLRKLNIKRWKTHNCGNTVSTIMKVLMTIENNRATAGFPSNCVTIFTCRITLCTCTNPGQYWSILPPEFPHIEIDSPQFPNV